MAIQKVASSGASGPHLAAASMAALGIVFGDIGTSPLYAFNTVLNLAGATPGANEILGSLSLILWTMFLIVSVKYVNLAMRFDNDGEGGVIAIMTLLGVKKHYRPAIIAFGLFGAALIYGDGAITPAISVLSALEGIEQAAPALQSYVLPLGVAILIGLFAVQPQGTAHIGRAFGPVMFLWFAVIALLGIHGIVSHPGVFAALNPIYGLHYLVSGGVRSFLVLGGVFLCVTGAEALYADLGHFGPKPIRLAWLGLVFPSLILNYAGQAAIVLDGAPATDNTFYSLCPVPLLSPLIVLATMATVIASQSIITGAFSMTRQAINLGWLPRLAIKQTSAEGYGQIYVGAVNWLLMIVTLALVLGFRRSDNLAAAYGVAVSLTMLITSVLLFIAMREIWGWSLPVASAVAAGLLVVDGAFFAANMSKVLQGGYVPLLLAIAIYVVMWTWHRGAVSVQHRVDESLLPMDVFLSELQSRNIARVPGTAVFLTRAKHGAPPVMVWHVKQNRSLHEFVMILTLSVASTPRVEPQRRIMLERVSPMFWRAELRYGFMDHLDVPAVLAECKASGCEIDVDDVTYYVGHETIISREDGRGLPRWQQALFALMGRNAARLSDFLKLPTDQVVEIGRQISI